MNRCKDCKWFDKFISPRFSVLPAWPISPHGACLKMKQVESDEEVSASQDEPMIVLINVYGHDLYVLPTHGCNAWEAKEGEK